MKVCVLGLLCVLVVGCGRWGLGDPVRGPVEGADADTRTEADVGAPDSDLDTPLTDGDVGPDDAAQDGGDAGDAPDVDGDQVCWLGTTDPRPTLSGSFDLTVTGAGLDAYEGVPAVVGVGLRPGTSLVRFAATTIASGDFSVAFPGILRDGESYDVFLYMDVDGDGVCNMMADDMALMRMATGITDDALVTFGPPGGLLPVICYPSNNPFPLGGDANLDGCVDSHDQEVLQSTLGDTGPNLPADFNLDGDVNLRDLGILSGNFCTCVQGGSA